MNRTCRVGTVEIGPGRPLAVIAGPCLLEDPDDAARTGEAVRDLCATLGLQFVFKASFDKANRSSVESPRGPGLDAGLDALCALRDRLGAPVTTDIHAPEQAEPAARAVDMLQIPAFLCRQTDLLLAAGQAASSHGRAVNVKKGQFAAPREMAGALGKLAEAGCRDVIVTERGTFFGYHRLVNDFVGIGDLIELGAPVCFDCTHSTQAPGAGATSGGRAERAPLLARAAVAAGVHAVFLETHPEPSRAGSDAETMLSLDEAIDLLPALARIRAAVETGEAAPQRPSGSNRGAAL